MRLLKTALFFFLCLMFSIGSAWAQPLAGSLREWNTSPLRPYDIEVLGDGSV